METNAQISLTALALAILAALSSALGIYMRRVQKSHCGCIDGTFGDGDAPGRSGETSGRRDERAQANNGDVSFAV